MPDEADATGSARMNMPSLGTGFNVSVPEVESTTTAINALAGSLSALKATIGQFSANPMMATGLNSMLRSIRSEATQTRSALAGIMGGGGAPSGGGGGGGGVPTGSGGGGGDWLASATAQAREGGIAAGAYLGTDKQESLLKATAMTPLRFLRDTINTNRGNVLAASGSLSLTSRQQNTTIENMLGTMARFPGSIYGNPSELISLFQNAPRMGASYNFGGQEGGQGVRAAGYFQGIRQAQQLNPAANVQDIAQMFKEFAGNSAAQRQGQVLTGGAYSMIAGGGRQKSLSEWAESVLKWLKGLRPGGNRGKDFTYGELMAQYFPGSNIDAWFDANAVPQNLRDYWWTYVLQRASQGNKEDFKIGGDETNLAQRRMEAATELTRTQFAMGSKMTGAYLNREQANKWFNQIFGQASQSLVTSVAGSGLGSWVNFLPDTIESFLMQGLENIGKGDVGDIGDSGYGEFGGTSTSGLSPNMRSKLGPMMRANPKLKVTSGLRDTAMQRRLKGKGYSRVSGGPSAHTRGDAADLGPPSQYGWIMANAAKFGLKSGKSQGEPWHVGVGDTLSDFVGNTPMGLMSELNQTGGTAEGAASFIAKFISSILGGLTSLTGSLFGKSDMGPAYDPNVYQKMVDASRGTRLGGISVGGVLGGGTTSSPLTPGGSFNSTGQYLGVRTPSDKAAAFQSSDEHIRGAAVAQALYAAGFRGQDLANMAAISYRESHWNPLAWNGVGQDRSGGLLQINQKPYLDKGQTPPYSVMDLLDPYANAKIAYDLFNKTIPNAGGYSPWTYPGEDWRYKVDFSKGQQAVRDAGLGDVEAMGYLNMMPNRSLGKGVVQFNNTFQINGGQGSGAGGIDVRRTVTMIANQLEDEMQRRMARTN
jgi:Lysozyme like domain